MTGGKGRRRVAALLVVGTVVVGCTEAAPGRPAESMLGELSTMDPCSLTDPAVFSPFGTATIDTPSSIYECIVDIATPAGAAGALWVGGLDRRESHPNIADKPERDLPDGLRVIEYAAGTNYCTRLLAFPDDVTLSVRYQILYGDDTPNECDVVAAAMDKVVGVIGEGAVKHRTFPPGSLGPIDPCAVTPADLPTAVPQLRAVKPIARPDKHACTWTNGDRDVRVKVEFRAGARKRNSAPGTKQTIAGRTTMVDMRKMSKGTEICDVSTVPVPFAAEGHSDLVELANVYVEIPDSQRPWACEVATAVATAVWPKLPMP